jgi:Na+/melibiose symporter-like transporter
MELHPRWQQIFGLMLLLRKRPSPLELQKGLGLLNMAPIVSFAFFKETLAIMFGVAIVKSKLLSKWIGKAGVVIGAVIIYAGIEVAYLAFGYANVGGLRGITMIIFSIWVGILGGLMWRKSMSMSNQKNLIRR